MKITTDRKLMLALSAGLIVFTVSGAMVGKAVAVEGTYTYLKLFNEALYLIVNNYVQPVQLESLMEGAYRGMLEALDPANEYLAARDFQRAARGESAGPADVGLTLSKRRGYITVVSAQRGAPAAEAGIGSGTVLISIDGLSTRSMGVWRATQALRGKPGTKVTATISAPPEAGLRRTVTLVRALLQPAVPVATLDGPDLGVARVAAVQEGDARRLEQAIAALKRRGAARLLLDLRGCSSASLAEAIGMASLFIRDGTIVSVTDRYEGDKAYRADGRRLAWERPLVVLVDEGTAGVCEVLAAALHDALDVPVLGERTWGHGSIHRLIPMQHGDGVFLAVGTYLSPSGKEWNGKGIQPDLPVEGEPSDPGDPQRQKAIDYLRGISLDGDRKAA
jgi:carboxyl-terminal processing protease